MAADRGPRGRRQEGAPGHGGEQDLRQMDGGRDAGAAGSSASTESEPGQFPGIERHHRRQHHARRAPRRCGCRGATRARAPMPLNARAAPAPVRPAACCGCGRSARRRRSSPCRCRGCRRAATLSQQVPPGGVLGPVDEHEVGGAARLDQPAVEACGCARCCRWQSRTPAPPGCRPGSTAARSSAGCPAAARPSRPARRCRGSRGASTGRARVPPATAAIATRSLPLCTISMARLQRSHSSHTCASGSAVWPPLMWPMMSASASSTTSLSISPEPGIDGPPVWMVLWMPCLRAQATISSRLVAGLHRAEADLAEQRRRRPRPVP